MKKWIANIAFIFLTINLIYSIKGAIPVAEMLFYPTMAFSLFMVLFSFRITNDIIISKGFKLFFYINFINLVYYIFFEFGDFDSFKYLLSRFTQFAIFSISIFMLGDKFLFHLLRFIKIVTIFSLIASLVFILPDFGDRYMGIFFNPNEFSIIMVLGFSVLLFQENRSNLENILMLAFVTSIFLSGSRSAIIGLILSLFMFIRHNKFSYIFLIFGLLIMFMFFLSVDKTNTFLRLFDESLFYNRQLEYIYAFETLMQKPFFGYGLKNYAFIDINVIDFDNPIDFGAHNGYLALLVQYGLIFGTLIFLLLSYGIVKVLKYDYSIKNENQNQFIFLKFILIYTLVNGVTENTFVGINYLQSNLFWLVLAYLLYKIYNYETSSLSD